MSLIIRRVAVTHSETTILSVGSIVKTKKLKYYSKDVDCKLEPSCTTGGNVNGAMLSSIVVKLKAGLPCDLTTPFLCTGTKELGP